MPHGLLSVARGISGRCRSHTVDVDDGLGKGFGGFLRKVVPYAAGEDAVGIFS